MYSTYKTNLDMLSTKNSVANQEVLSQAGVKYMLSHGWYTQLKFGSFSRKDRLNLAQYDMEEKAYSLGLGRSAGKVNFHIETRYADQFDNLNSTNTSPYSCSSYISYRPSSNLYLALYGGWGSNNSLSGSRLLSDQDNLEFSFNWKALEKLALKGWYTKYNFSSNMYESDTSRLEICYTMPDSNCLSLKNRRYSWNYGEQMRTDYVLSYNMSFSIAIGKKKSLGTILGKVLDLSQGQRNTLPRGNCDYEWEKSNYRCFRNLLLYSATWNIHLGS